MKQCNNCKKILSVDTNNFRIKSSNRDGFQSTCKNCMQRYNKVWVDNNKEKVRKQKRNWAAVNADLKLEQHREWQKRNREHVNEINRNWNEKNKERVEITNKAVATVRTAIKQGILIRANKCAACKIIEWTEASHDDYTKPLEVVWLCIRCHRQKDSIQPKTLVLS